MTSSAGWHFQCPDVNVVSDGHAACEPEKKNSIRQSNFAIWGAAVSSCSVRDDWVQFTPYLLINYSLYNVKLKQQSTQQWALNWGFGHLQIIIIIYTINIQTPLPQWGNARHGQRNCNSFDNPWVFKYIFIQWNYLFSSLVAVWMVFKDPTCWHTSTSSSVLPIYC